MKFKIFGKIIEIKAKEKELYEYGAEAKKKQSIKKIEEALEIMKNSKYKYSEYRLKKISGLSINTIKKYRSYIKKWRKNNNYI